MDVTRLLESDHRMVEDLLGRIERAEGGQRTPLIEELSTSLLAHMELEEKLLYPAMTPVTGEESAEEGVTEHRLARDALTEVEQLAPDQPGFEAALEVLKAGISHHVEDEEKEVFKELRADGAVLEQIATPFMTMRLELGMPIDADALARSASKEELVAEAEKAGVNGATSMRKEELAGALAQRMNG